MPGNEGDEDQMMWMDDEAAAESTEAAAAAATANDPERAAQLEAELARTRTELADVRRDLAAKVRTGPMHKPPEWIHAWRLAVQLRADPMQRLPAGSTRMGWLPGTPLHRSRQCICA